MSEGDAERWLAAWMKHAADEGVNRADRDYWRPCWGLIADQRKR